ncbi:MAG: hypothetical protein PHF89_05005 [Eubacteriales bacterium]|nr:hypothetical protein [Eubacteriales bacterium]
MSPKELLYLEDALSHEVFLTKQFEDAAQNLQDPELKNCVQQMVTKRKQILSSLYQTV